MPPFKKVKCLTAPIPVSPRDGTAWYGFGLFTMPGGTAFGGSTSPTLLFAHSVAGTLTPPLAGTVDPGCDTFPAPQKCLITARIAGDVWSIPWYLCRVATAVSNGAGFPAEANHEGLRWYCKPRAKPESLYFYKPRALALGFMTRIKSAYARKWKRKEGKVWRISNGSEACRIFACRLVNDFSRVKQPMLISSIYKL